MRGGKDRKERAGRERGEKASDKGEGIREERFGRKIGTSNLGWGGGAWWAFPFILPFCSCAGETEEESEARGTGLGLVEVKGRRLLESLRRAAGGGS